MLKGGILNPAINSLLSRVRHTNTLVIADRGFPYWPHVETIDISLTDDIPRVMDVLAAIKANFAIGQVFAAAEFLSANPPQTASARVIPIIASDHESEPPGRAPLARRRKIAARDACGPSSRRSVSPRAGKGARSSLAPAWAGCRP